MAKRKIGELLGRPIVVADNENEVTKNDIYATSEIFGEIELFVRNTKGKLVLLNDRLL